MKTKPAAKDALELRVGETIYYTAKPLAERFLELAYRHHRAEVDPRQQQLLIRHLLGGHGFGLAYEARVNSDRAFAELDRLEQWLIAKPGDGSDEF